MTCAEIREQLSARADNALGAAESAALDAHLATCPECRREWQRFAATVSLLRAVEPARAPAGFVERVVQAARPQPWYVRLARGLLVPWTVKLPLEAAAIVMVAGLAVLVFQRSAPMQEMAQLGELKPHEAPAEPRSGEALLLSHEARKAAESPGAVLTDSRAAGAQPDAGRSDAQAPRLAQQQAGEALLAQRQQAPAVAPAPPPEAPAAKSAPSPAAVPAPSAPNVARSIESYAEPRAKRQDKLAKEAERDAVGGVMQGARKSEAPQSMIQGLGIIPPPAAVELSLAVSDRAAAEREVATVVERLGGAMMAPSPGMLEIMVPSRVFAALTGDLARIGTLRIVRQPSDLPDSVRISLRLTD